jgi:excisionase family DNA binding protein
VKLERRLYSIKEVALYLGRSPWTIAEMVRTGKLPYVPDGKRRFLDIEDINKWIVSNKKRDID